ncbi:uncharacterized protein B0T23DRAFT_407811 [Neurospora hispaniola]|uniref:Uncharacterized protein n=1 Tax=Neurospora hispaniola TaxID=588809 RepID=A0AAJ0MNC2_9PEZI|nr:hypothetical protein B0T23DRAFT_407811 [Neurospora hispaniola]
MPTTLLLTPSPYDPSLRGPPRFPGPWVSRLHPAISAATRAHITTEKLKSCTATRILQSQPQDALPRTKNYHFDFLPHQPYFGRDASLGPDGRRRRGATAKPLGCMYVIRIPARGRPVDHFHVSVSASLIGEADGLHPHRVAAEAIV